MRSQFKATLSIHNTIKSILIIVCLILPFQKFPSTIANHFSLNKNIVSLTGYLNYLDEFIVLSGLLSLLAYLLLRPNLIIINNNANISIFIAFILFITTSTISLIINNVPQIMGFFGIYDSSKSFLILFLFLLVRFRSTDIISLLQKLSYVLIILATVAIVGEILAIYFNLGINLFVSSQERFGLYRVISLVGPGSWNYIGLFAVLIFFFTLENKWVKFKKITLGLAIMLIILTLSRQAWAAFFIMLFLKYRNNIPLIIMSSSILLVIFILWGPSFINNLFYDFDVITNSDKYFRLFALQHAVQLYSEQPILGHGPGMFGGLASILFESPLYATWPSYFIDFLQATRSIDQFWPSLLVETGGIGLILYLIIYITIYKAIKNKTHNKAYTNDLVKFGEVLSNYIVVVIIMGLFGGINSSIIIFTYFAFVGMYLGMEHSQILRKP